MVVIEGREKKMKGELKSKRIAGKLAQGCISIGMLHSAVAV